MEKHGISEGAILSNTTASRGGLNHPFLKQNIMGENKTSGFTLPERSVTVKFIPKRKGMAAGDHIGKDHLISGGMIDNAVVKYMVPRNRTGKGLVNVLNRDEKAHLEDITGLNLSVYGDFWYEQSVNLTKQDTIFDLSNPSDFIQIAILKANSKEVAIGYENKNARAEYKFVIVEEGEELKVKKKSYDNKKKAWKEYGRIEDQKDILMAVLRLLENKAISDNTSIDWLQGKVESYVDDKPTAFLNVITDPSFETRALIQTGVAKGVVVREGNKFSTIDGLELAEEGEVPTFEIAVRYLDKVKNQSVRDLISARIDEVDNKAPKRGVKAKKTK